jgi:hypothetical protein
MSKTTNSPSGMKNDDPRWRPRRKGSRYCAPACGRGCTVAEFVRATEIADAIAAKLGRGWRGVVWENMGWHAKAVHDAGIEVRPHGPRSFAAMTETGSHQVGRTNIVHQHGGYGSTPTAALKNLRAALARSHSAAALLLVAIDGAS